MSVYFIRVGGYFKIGATDDAERRCANLHKSGTRYTFPPGVSLRATDRELYKVIVGWKQDERVIHDALDQFAVGLEWFLDEPLVRSFIDGLPVEGLDRNDLPVVERPGGWCEAEFRAVQHGRAEREMARWMASRVAS